jgi:G:T-mismatch repair DNA endonuclease (very short patch repair protein)
MLNIDSFIVKEGNTFYFDLEEYNTKTDVIIEESDIVKFTYEGVRYIGKVCTIGTKKNQSFVLEIIKKS